MKEKCQTDSIYKTPRDRIRPFVFDTSVTEVFTDMINRSVPGYQTVLEMLGVITHEYAIAGSQLYDLGCSRGASSLAIYNNIRVADTHLVAIDNSPSMIEATTRLFAGINHKDNLHIICEDIQKTKIQPASLICLNLTLQFIPESQRFDLIKKCYDALLPGGVIVLFEKVISLDKQQEAIRNQLHKSFKRANGYSKLEISQKRIALEEMLIPDTELQHTDRLKRVGFDFIEIFFHCLNFSAFLAIKK